MSGHPKLIMIHFIAAIAYAGDQLIDLALDDLSIVPNKDARFFGRFDEGLSRLIGRQRILQSIQASDTGPKVDRPFFGRPVVGQKISSRVN